MIEVECPDCYNVLKVPEKYEGRTGKCSACGSKVRIPRMTVVFEDPAQSIERFQISDDVQWSGRPSLFNYWPALILGVLLTPFFVGPLIFVLVLFVWRSNRYVITGRRICSRTGITAIEEREVEIQDVRHIRTVRGTLLGTIRFFTAGTDNAEIEFKNIGDTEGLKRLVRFLRDHPVSKSSKPAESKTKPEGRLETVALVVVIVVSAIYPWANRIRGLPEVSNSVNAETRTQPAITLPASIKQETEAQTVEPNETDDYFTPRDGIKLKPNPVRALHTGMTLETVEDLLGGVSERVLELDSDAGKSTAVYNFFLDNGSTVSARFVDGELYAWTVE